MADIIVRIPKGQLDHFRHDKLSAPEAFWRFAQKPKRLTEGEDYIWFTRPEGVIAGAKVLGIVSEVDDTPDPVGKWNALWEGDEMSLLDPPVKEIQYEGRSYRYLTDAEQSQLRNAIKP